MAEWSTSCQPQESEPAVARWRWWVYLVLLGGYPIGAGLVSTFAGPAQTSGRPLIPTDPVLLAQLMASELIIFGVLFGLAWVFPRPSADQMLLRWRGRIGPIARGFFYSIGLRLAISLMVVLVSAVLAFLVAGDGQLVEKLRPDVEHVVDAKALSTNPVYLWLNLTVVSFVLAGFREELWRAGMLAGLAGVVPSRFATPKGQYAAAGIAAIIFGLGHLTQGWGGVAMTTLLGFGLGAIMISRQSIWDAVMAHGFFNATTFATLALLARWRPDMLPGH